MLTLPQIAGEWITPPTPKRGRYLSEFSWNDEDGMLDEIQIDSSAPLLNVVRSKIPDERRSYCAKLRKVSPALPILLFGLVIGISGIFSLLTVTKDFKPCSEHFTVMIIRHVEKNLHEGISSEGQCRANLLPSVFNGETLPEPQILVTYIPSVNRPSLRGIQTLLPISDQLNLNLMTWTNSHYQEMLQDIIARACGRTVLVAWHDNYPSIENMVVDMGVNQSVASAFASQYGGNYDAVWILNYYFGLNVTTNLTIELEGLGRNPCDSQGV